MNEALSEKAVLDKQREVLHFHPFPIIFPSFHPHSFFILFNFSRPFHPFGPFSI